MLWYTETLGCFFERGILSACSAILYIHLPWTMCLIEANPVIPRMPCTHHPAVSPHPALPDDPNSITIIHNLPRGPHIYRQPFRRLCEATPSAWSIKTDAQYRANRHVSRSDFCIYCHIRVGGRQLDGSHFQFRF